MSNSNFRFLNTEYPGIARLGVLSERNVFEDPSTSLTKLRILSEQITLAIGQFEGLRNFEELRQFDRIRILENEGIAPREIINTFHKLRKSGNKGAHTDKATSAEARFMLKQCFNLAKWFFELYENDEVGDEYIVPVKSASSDELYEQAINELDKTKLFMDDV